jgi:hypothetical protein
MIINNTKLYSHLADTWQPNGIITYHLLEKFTIEKNKCYQIYILEWKQNKK